MARWHLFSTDEKTGKTTEYKGSPELMRAKMADHKAAGRKTFLADEDERILMGQVADKLRKGGKR